MNSPIQNAGGFLSRNKYILKKRGYSAIFRIVWLLAIFSLSYLFLFPVFYMVTTSFQNPASARDPSVVWIPKGLSATAFSGAFKELKFAASAILTAQNSIFSTIVSLISCSMAGYAFARFKFPLKKLAFGVVLLMIIVPPQTLTMSNYLQYSFFDFGGILAPFSISFNLLGTPLVFALPALFAAGLRAGLFIFIFRQYFSGLPHDLEEAALIDGCGPYKTFVRIMVPLAGPAYVTVTLFSVIWHWNEYYNSAMYFIGDIKPLSVMLKNLQSALEMGGFISAGSSTYLVRMYIQAGALLTILPPLLLYIFTQKFFTESIGRSGIVG